MRCPGTRLGSFKEPTSTEKIFYAFSGSIRPLVLLLEYPGKNGRLVQRRAGKGEAGLDGFFAFGEGKGLTLHLGEE